MVGLDPIGLGNHHFQRHPPQPADAFGEIAGDIHGKGRIELPHHRQRKIPVIAIAVVESEAGEAARKIADDQPPMHLVDADDVDAAAAQVRQRRAQEIRRDFEMTIGLERAAAPRADVVQREDGSDPGEDRSQQLMGAAEIQRFQAGADDVVAKLLHHMAGPLMVWVKLAEQR